MAPSGKANSRGENYLSYLPQETQASHFRLFEMPTKEAIRGTASIRHNASVNMRSANIL